VDACGPDHFGGCDPNANANNGYSGCAPDHCLDTDQDAVNATHGGQVGASVGIATAFDPDSKCIKGEWQHVRHDVMRPKLNGIFHARNFDSLQCACLSCTENSLLDPLAVPGTLCNPDDRICGPEPRRAPDNKICFSGVGDYALTNGKKTKRSVVFRVDVTDRSEPGGTNGTPPPDRYRIRLWFADCPGQNSCSTLRQQVECLHPETEDLSGNPFQPTPAPDIDDGGDLIRGNQQIHPAIKDTCPSHP